MLSPSTLQALKKDQDRLLAEIKERQDELSRITDILYLKKIKQPEKAKPAKSSKPKNRSPRAP